MLMQRGRVGASLLVAVLALSIGTMSAQVTGNGTPGQIPLWVSRTVLGDSLIMQTAGNIAIGTTTPTAKLHVLGGSNHGIKGESDTGPGVIGLSNSSSAPAVLGTSSFSIGVQGTSTNDIGVVGQSISGPGVQGFSPNNNGVIGRSDNRDGVFGTSTYGIGVLGSSTRNHGVAGGSSGGNGVNGYCTNSSWAGVYGTHDTNGRGVQGYSNFGNGVVGTSVGLNGVGVYGLNPAGGLAGAFEGDVYISGNLKTGESSFKIEHPLDPENKYLSHSAVHSPDMMNVYNGNVTTDVNGEAVVNLPDYFEALNTDFRYQLTVIGQFAQAIVGSKIKDHRFTIRTNQPNVEVSWQVTGIRKDRYAENHRIRVEEERPERERSFYLHPTEYGQPEEKSILFANHPEMMRQIKQEMEKSSSSNR